MSGLGGSKWDICQDLRGGSKRTYVGGASPNTPPYSQLGVLIYERTPGDISLLTTHGGMNGGVPPRYFRFVLWLRSRHKWTITWLFTFQNTCSTFYISIFFFKFTAFHKPHSDLHFSLSFYHLPDSWWWPEIETLWTTPAIDGKTSINWLHHRYFR